MNLSSTQHRDNRIRRQKNQKRVRAAKRSQHWAQRRTVEGTTSMAGATETVPVSSIARAGFESKGEL